MKSNILKGIGNGLMGRVPLYVFAVISLSLVACDKSKERSVKVEDVRVGKDETVAEVLNRVAWKADGGRDTLYVSSSSEVQVSFETGEVDNWLKIDKIEAITGANKWRVILEIKPMVNSFKKRIGVLNFTTSSTYAGAFIGVTQGYDSRIEESFTWLKYGTGTPLDLTKATRISQWSAAQKLYGWTSSESLSNTFGMNGYVLLGTAKEGANLLSAIVPGFERDSLLLLTFNAVGFVTKEGVKDNNKLTVKLLGGEFDDNTSLKSLELKYYDHLSALLLSKMWEDSQFVFVIKKPSLNPTSSTMQLEFINGEGSAAAGNRVFVDNVNLYSTDQFSVKDKK